MNPQIKRKEDDYPQITQINADFRERYTQTFIISERQWRCTGIC